MGFIEPDKIEYVFSIQIEHECSGLWTVYSNGDELDASCVKLSDAYRYAADRFLDLEHQARISELQERINKL